MWPQLDTLINKHLSQVPGPGVRPVCPTLSGEAKNTANKQFSSLLAFCSPDTIITKTHVSNYSDSDSDSDQSVNSHIMNHVAVLLTTDSTAGAPSSQPSVAPGVRLASSATWTPAGSLSRTSASWRRKVRENWWWWWWWWWYQSPGRLYCEDCYGRYLAPSCSKCRKKITGGSSVSCVQLHQTLSHVFIYM